MYKVYVSRASDYTCKVETMVMYTLEDLVTFMRAMGEALIINETEEEENAFRVTIYDDYVE